MSNIEIIKYYTELYKNDPKFREFVITRELKSIEEIAMEYDLMIPQRENMV